MSFTAKEKKRNIQNQDKQTPHTLLQKLPPKALYTPLKSTLNPFSATRRYKRHQNKVKVKDLGRNSSYIAGFSIPFHCSAKKFNQLAKKNYLKFFSLA